MTDQRPAPGYDYLAAKQQARDPDPLRRRALAERPDTPPEILAFLAGDPDERVRGAVADHPRTPLRASGVLAQDRALLVREILAARLPRLLPDLDAQGQANAQRLAFAIIAQLAVDQAITVRAALASAAADIAAMPYDVVRQLAFDAEQAVAEPILRACLKLSDDDLLALLAHHGGSWARQAIARRPHLSATMSQALSDRADPVAIPLLLDNRGAVIAEPVLAELVEQAGYQLSYQEPLARRPALPQRLLARLAEFVDQAILRLLQDRPDLEPAARAAIQQTARRRIALAEQATKGQPPAERARHCAAAGQLDATFLQDALAMGDFALLRAGLALLARVPLPTAERMLDSGSGRSVVALCWRAGLPMRLALMLQVRLVGLPAAKIVNARHGTDYPLPDSVWREQLELYGITG